VWAGTSAWRSDGTAQPILPAVEATTARVDPVVESAVRSYDIEAAFYRVRSGDEERLTSTSRLRVDDELRLSVQTTVPAYIYVVNEDEKGNAFLLFPLPDGGQLHPLPANRPVRLPPGDNWLVNSVGDREHFLIFASTDPLTAFDEVFKKLPAPQRGQRKPPAVKLPSATIDTFRGVGGLAPTQPRRDIGARFRDLFTTPLEGRETTQGMWVRQLTIANPPD
jgi:Domain of unknown function (DUF4384)